jgi:hypothetical protein
MIFPGSQDKFIIFSHESHGCFIRSDMNEMASGNQHSWSLIQGPSECESNEICRFLCFGLHLPPVFYYYYYYLLSQVFFLPWYFSSWASGEPHHSGFKSQLEALSLLLLLLLLILLWFMSRGSSVSTVSDHGLDDLAIGVRSPAGV